MVVVFATSSGASYTRSCTAPSGYTLRHGSSDPHYEAFVCAAEKLVATAGAENPGAWAIATGNGCPACVDDTYAATIAIAPAAASTNSVLFYVR